MGKQKTPKYKEIWLSALILFVCVASTTIAFMSRLNGYLLDDSGAIPLIGEGSEEVSYHVGEKEQEAVSSEQASSDASEAHNTEQPLEKGETVSVKLDKVLAPSTQTTVQRTQFESEPGFEAEDTQVVWNHNTQVEIFRVSYADKEQTITVHSADGDKVIAPGTENSYTFKLKNTGNVALDYTVEVEAFFTPEDVVIPVTGRISRYDGTWIVGGQAEYTPASAWNNAKDQATLGAGKYTYYTLDWLWPFESGNDALDTSLGNLAVGQDLVFTIVIKTTATGSMNPQDSSGITPPQTGDTSNLALWIVLAAVSFALLLFLIFYSCRERKDTHTEAKGF